MEAPCTVRYWIYACLFVLITRITLMSSIFILNLILVQDELLETCGSVFTTDWVTPDTLETSVFLGDNWLFILVAFVAIIVLGVVIICLKCYCRCSGHRRLPSGMFLF